MCFMSFMSIFINVPGQFFITLYGGLVVFSLYVIYDTQAIIEKASFGDLDVVKHTLDLFIDFIAIFIRILIILMKNSSKKKKKDDRN